MKKREILYLCIGALCLALVLTYAVTVRRRAYKVRRVINKLNGYSDYDWPVFDAAEEVSQDILDIFEKYFYILGEP